MSKYDGSNIQILEGLEPVRKRPGMYIGSTDSRGLHHLIWEIVDNGVDEILAGHGDEVSVVINKDNSLTITDNGRGVPTDMHPSGVPTAQVIYTVLHAGGKFGQEGGAYKVSGGLHGVGASVVNALSEWMIVEIYRGGKKYEIKFSEGGSKISKLVQKGTTSKRGTSVTFKPDDKIFSTTQWKYATIAERLKETSFLLSGVKMKIDDQRPNGKKEEFCYKDGLKEYVEFVSENNTEVSKTNHITGTLNQMELEVAFKWVDTYTPTIISFVNNVKTREGGTHETGFKSALTKEINDYAKANNLIKGNQSLDGDDVREGLVAIISLRVPEHLLQYEGQTKGKLGTPEARNAVEQLVSEKLKSYLIENKVAATDIINKAKRAFDARAAAKKARTEARKIKKASSSEKILSGKLTPAQSKDKSKLELYLVEGDSAGGSAKLGRDRKFQAILPLKGKVINTEKAKLIDVIKNEEVGTVINTIGAGIGTDFDVRKSNYNKIIIMTDADTDGAHIQVLLLTFFFRYMRPLIEAGMVYIALPPLYKISKGRGKEAKIKYAWDDAEYKATIDELGKCEVQRFKGLGEMNADQLWDTTMNPETRVLIKVNIDDAAIAERRVSTLMGDNVEPRRIWIEENVDFKNEDSFDINEAK